MSASRSMHQLWLKLGEYAATLDGGQFLAGATLEFLGEDVGDHIEHDDDFTDYLLCVHRDENERTVLDHFEDERGKSLDEDERALLEVLKSSEYGLYHVDRLEGEDSVIARRLGNHESATILCPEDLEDLHVGSSFAARIAPAKDRYHLLGAFRLLPPVVADLAERLAEKSPAVAEQLTDSILIRRVLVDLPWDEDPPESRLEAQLRAALSFEDLGLDISVEEVEGRLQDSRSAMDMLRSLPKPDRRDEEATLNLAHALSALWNYTPREDLGGLSPIDRHERRKNIPLVHPETLPGADRLVRTRECMEELLRSGKPPALLFAIRRVTERRDLYGGLDLLPAARRILELGERKTSSILLDSLSQLRGWSQAPELAGLVAEFFAELDSAEVGDRALSAITALDAKPHEHFLRDLLKDDRSDHDQVYKALAAAGGDDNADLILEHLQTTDSAYDGAVAVAMLAALQDPARLARGLPAYLDAAGESLEARLDALCAQIPEELLGEPGLCRVAESLCEQHFHPEDPGGIHEALLHPRTDPAAARRALQLVPEARIAELSRLSKKGQVRKLVHELRDLVLEGLKQASADHPPYAPLARVLGVLAEELARPERVREMARPELERLEALLVTLLSRALRGRDVVHERLQARGDIAQLVELAAFDGSWVDEDAFRALAASAPDDQLRRLAGSPDGEVANLAKYLLVARAPASHLKTTLTSAAFGIDLHLFPWTVALAGDAVLPIIVDAWAENPSPIVSVAFLMAIRTLGTERSRAYLEANVGLFEAPHLLVDTVVAAAQSCESVRSAEQLAALVREARVDLSHLDDDEGHYLFEESHLGSDLDGLFELCGLVLDADEIVSAGVNLRNVRGGDDDLDTDDEECVEPWENGEHEHDGCCEDPDHHHHEHHHHHHHDFGPRLLEFHRETPELDGGPADPIVREGPKLGRNDPCPCGSGKKHKKCCGKV